MMIEEELGFGGCHSGLARKKVRTASTKSAYPERMMMMDDPTLSRLSRLPDHILHSIMTLLPVDEAIRTCILSRRWEHLWRSMPCLNFTTLWPRFGEKTHHQLINFINGACTLRDEEFPIQSFCLGHSLTRDESDAPLLSSWIKSAVKGGVRDLFLILSSPTQQYVLPLCIFSSETLVKLDLRLQNSITLRLPAANSLYLPSLKDLHLVAVIFDDGESLEQLLSSPSLDKLAIVNCIWAKINNNIKSLKISAPKLRVLHIFNNSSLDSLPPLWLCSDSLDTLYCNLLLKNKIHISTRTMKKIHCAELHLDNRSIAQNVLRLLNHLSGVKTLTLSSGALEVFNYSSELFEKLPQFNNLISLNLSGFKSYGITAVALLWKTPYLETLYFMGRFSGSLLDMPRLDPVPLCFVNHLKKIIVRPFRGKDIDAIGIMLKAGLVLQDMIVDNEYCCYEQGEEKEEESVLFDMLHSLPKASKSCRITKRCAP